MARLATGGPRPRATSMPIVALCLLALLQSARGARKGALGGVANSHFSRKCVFISPWRA